MNDDTHPLYTIDEDDQGPIEEDPVPNVLERPFGNLSVNTDEGQNPCGFGDTVANAPEQLAGDARAISEERQQLVIIEYYLRFQRVGIDASGFVHVVGDDVPFPQDPYVHQTQHGETWWLVTVYTMLRPINDVEFNIAPVELSPASTEIEDDTDTWSAWSDNEANNADFSLDFDEMVSDLEYEEEEMD